MMLTVLQLIALLPVASAGLLHGPLWQWVWGNAWDSQYKGQCSCTSPHIPLDDKLSLIGRNSDHYNDGVVTFGDLWYDITMRFDTNHDGRLSESECVEQYRCAYGDTEQVAQFQCANLLNGEAAVSINDFQRPPFITGEPLHQFVATQRALYERFFTNRCTNRELTREEKLTYNTANNNYNGDNFVTAEEIFYDLRVYYDTDKDGRTSRAEFVIRWTCNYADRGDYARYLWDDVFTNGTSSIPNNYFSGPQFDNVPVEVFKATARKNYENFRTRDASAYIQPPA